VSNMHSKKIRVIEIVSYNPEWPNIFKKEAKTISNALGRDALEINHFGSTSVPELAAKPKIDILIVVKSFSSIDISVLETLGYEYLGEVIPSGRFLTKRKGHKVHLHIFEEENPLIARNLMFRDWLQTHADDRRAYEKLKKKLATHHSDGADYCQAKSEFVNKTIEKAGG
jgi:GrpB-like predicted nucleotidyltransferase (UPF0157 family)